MLPVHPSEHAVHPVVTSHSVSGDKHEHMLLQLSPQSPMSQAVMNPGIFSVTVIGKELKKDILFQGEGEREKE